jgi:hypothetical protein
MSKCNYILPQAETQSVPNIWNTTTLNLRDIPWILEFILTSVIILGKTADVYAREPRVSVANYIQRVAGQLLLRRNNITPCVTYNENEFTDLQHDLVHNFIVSVSQHISCSFWGSHSDDYEADVY